MATFRERPYSQFNFLVNIGEGTDGPKAGFQEVSGIGFELTVAEYRTGNDKVNTPIKINGMYKVPDITLKRGLIGAEDLYDWIKQVKEGQQQEALRNVTIQLLSEDRSAVAVTWKLTAARPMKYTAPTFNGKGTDIAIEELVLACENIEIE